MAEKILPENQQPFTRILLLALDLGQYDMDRSLEELTALAQANRMEVAAQIVQKRDAPETGTVLGAGKLEEARLYACLLYTSPGCRWRPGPQYAPARRVPGASSR